MARPTPSLEIVSLASPAFCVYCALHVQAAIKGRQLMQQSGMETLRRKIQIKWVDYVYLTQVEENTDRISFYTTRNDCKHL